VCRLALAPEAFAAWGWRVPFIISIALLAISLWMRLKLNESPVFQAMKREQRTSSNPFKESFTYPGNKKRIFVALFGVTGSLTTIFYAAYFSSLSFLKGPMRVDATTAELLVLVAGPAMMAFYVAVGKWSDKVGRKKPIIWGNILILLTIFPAFWALGHFANPGLTDSARAAPVVVSGPDCDYDPFASAQATNCGKLISDLTAGGVSYDLSSAPALSLHVGTANVPVEGFDWTDGAARKAQLEGALTAAGYDFSVQHPGPGRALGIVAMLLFFGFLSAMNYGSVAALLAEMFPPKIRYSSMSIPYHIGAGYFGGFLPVIAGYIVARTGDMYAGLWYTWAFVAIALVVGWWGIPSGPPRDFADEIG
jgi:MFS family permease